MPRQSSRHSFYTETSPLDDSWIVNTGDDADYNPRSGSSSMISSKLTPGGSKQRSQRVADSISASRNKKSKRIAKSKHKAGYVPIEINEKESLPIDVVPPSNALDLNRKQYLRAPWREFQLKSKSELTPSSNITTVSDDQSSGSDLSLGSILSRSEGLSEVCVVEQSQTPTRSSEKPRRRQPRTFTNASDEPDLIMPSIHSNLDGSWIGEDMSKHDRGFGILRGMTRSRGKERPNVLRNRNYIDHARLNEAEAANLNFSRPILGWFYDIIGGALGTLKKPISYVLAGYLLLGLFMLLRNLLTNSVYSALSPICRLPGSSLLQLPICQSGVAANYEGSEPPLVQFDQLMRVQSNFEAIIEESAGGVSLPLNMKRGEASIRDLRQIVRYSSIRSKNELVLEFDGFIETARIASYDLQKFNSHVGRSVDNILATARWTKRVLDGIADRDGSLGTITSFFTNKLFAPFQPLKFTEDILLDQYIQHTRVVEQEIHRLIAEAQALLHVLQNLEDRLDVMHGISVREDIHAQSSKAEVLSQLWTIVGGNRGKLGRFDSQLRLLQQVNSYRQSAIAHVSGTMVKLQGMGTELEELRERVGGAELLGIKSGIPLSVHIENIELGVERLEKGRDRAKGVENEELRKILSRQMGEPKGIEEG